jgi:hypothetical protein
MRESEMIDIIQRRLNNQLLARRKLARPEEVMAWQGAVQAQDYAGARWAVGQRLAGGANDTAVEQAFNEGKILRTHVMRPTWHFVAAEDIRWLLALTAPRVQALNATMYRQLELDESLLQRGSAVIAEALAGGQQLTRAELSTTLGAASIAAEKMRLAYIVMYAELEGIICSGPRRGKQFTYALLAERAPQARLLEREESLAELTQRYFTSHGPAAVQDFAWWSGLTTAEARAGLELVKSALVEEMAGDQSYWLAPDIPITEGPSPTAHLLPNYDEYLISTRDSTPFLDPDHLQLLTESSQLFPHCVVIDGRLVGSWRRQFKKNKVIISLNLFAPLNQAQQQAIHEAAEEYARFLNMEAVVEE